MLVSVAVLVEVRLGHFVTIHKGDEATQGVELLVGHWVEVVDRTGLLPLSVILQTPLHSCNGLGKNWGGSFEPPSELPLHSSQAKVGGCLALLCPGAGHRAPTGHQKGLLWVFTVLQEDHAPAAVAGLSPLPLVQALQAVAQNDEIPIEKEEGA